MIWFENRIKLYNFFSNIRIFEFIFLQIKSNSQNTKKIFFLFLNTPVKTWRFPNTFIRHRSKINHNRSESIRIIQKKNFNFLKFVLKNPGRLWTFMDDFELLISIFNVSRKFKKNNKIILQIAIFFFFEYSSSETLQ